MFSLKKKKKRKIIPKLTLLPFIICSSGPGCSKLTTLLVNVSLKFQTLISQICKICSAKASFIFSTKNFCVFGYKVVKHLMS